MSVHRSRPAVLAAVCMALTMATAGGAHSQQAPVEQFEGTLVVVWAIHTPTWAPAASCVTASFCGMAGCSRCNCRGQRVRPLRMSASASSCREAAWRARRGLPMRPRKSSRFRRSQKSGPMGDASAQAVSGARRRDLPAGKVLGRFWPCHLRQSLTPHDQPGRASGWRAIPHDPELLLQEDIVGPILLAGRLRRSGRSWCVRGVADAATAEELLRPMWLARGVCLSHRVGRRLDGTWQGAGH